MKRKALCFLMGMLVLLLPGCQSEQEDLYSQALSDASAGSSEAAPGEAKKELTVLVSYDNTQLNGLAEEYQAAHPDVTINVEVGLSSAGQGGEDWNDFVERVTTELLSGEGPDLLVDPGAFTKQDYLTSDLVYDLREWMENDPEFTLSDYYENLFEAFTIEGHQFTFPLTYAINLAYLNKDLCDLGGWDFSPWEHITYGDVLDLYDAILASGQISLPQEFTLEFMDQRGPEALFKDIEIPSFIDSETKTCTFDSDQFIQYLERTKSIPSNRSPGEVVSLSGGNVLELFSQSNSEAATSLLMRDSPYLSNLLDLTSIPENCAGPFVLSSTSGDTAFFADLTMVVPKSCTDPELAWDFLKFCVSPVEVPAYATAYHPEGSVDLVWGSLPMSRENMERYSQLYGKIERIYRESSTLPAGFDPASFDDPFSQEFLEKFDQAVSSLNFAVNDIAPMESIYNPILKTYYGTNTLSAQECARQIQDRVEIWLNE